MKNQSIFIVASILFLAGLFLINSNHAYAAPLAGVNADMTQVAYDNGGTFTDETADANNTTINDVQVCGGANNDAFYLGMPNLFDQIAVKYDTACAAGHAGAWEYRKSDSTWAALTVTDNTAGFENAATTTTIDITLPTDWVTVDPDGGGAVTTSAYFIRFRTTTFNADVVGGSQFSAQEFNLKVKAQDELGTAITGLATGAFTVTGGTDNTKFSFREISAGAYELALDTAGADVNFDYTAQKDGYVTSASAATGNMTTSLTDLTGTPRSLNFAYKVTAITTEVLVAAITSSVTTFTYGDPNAENTCSLSGGAWYCPVLLNNSDGTMTTTVTLNGYVQQGYTPVAGTNRLTNGAAQVSTTVTGIKYSHTLTLTSAAAHGGFAVTGATVTNNLGGTAEVYTENGTTGVYYGVIPFANDNVAVTVSKAGWTTNTGTTSGDRAANTTVQQAQTNATLVYSALTGFSVSKHSASSFMNASWTASSDTGNFSKYELYSRITTGVTNSNGTLFGKTEEGTTALETRTTASTVVSGLACGTTYYFTMYTLDTKSNRTTLATEASATTEKCPAAPDLTTPSPVTNFVAMDTKTGGSIKLTWTNSPESDFKQVRIHRDVTLDFQPGTLNQIAIVTGSPNTTKTYTDTGLNNGTTYHYKIRTEDSVGNIQSGLAFPTASVIPTAPPPGETPPAEQPPVEQPPAEQPPAEQPPAIPSPPSSVPPSGQVTPESPGIADGDLLRASNTIEVYVTKKVGALVVIRHIVNPRIFDIYGHFGGVEAWSKIAGVDSLGSARKSAWVRGSDGKVWEVNGDGTRHWMNMTWDQFASRTAATDSALATNLIFEVNDLELDLYTQGVAVRP